MKKTLVLAILLGLLAGALFAPEAAAKKKKKKRVERVVESEYQAPAIGTTGNGACLNATNSCGRALPAAGEKYVKVEIDDATGTPVSFSLGQDSDPEALGTETDLGEFCGTTDTFIALQDASEVVVFPWMLGPTCGAVATTGTVTFTFSNLP